MVSYYTGIVCRPSVWKPGYNHMLAPPILNLYGAISCISSRHCLSSHCLNGALSSVEFMDVIIWEIYRSYTLESIG